ncbi:MAG TPA: hypothetical protein VEX35_03280 [Allosphingosinicella sp.]|nr:hypothetical protein [Allosphingosinicella sp.]
MKRVAPLPLLALSAALAACGPGRERSVNEIYDETNRAIVNTAADYEGRVENDLQAREQALDAQANEQLRRFEANAANAANAAAGNEMTGNGQ